MHVKTHKVHHRPLNLPRLHFGASKARRLKFKKLHLHALDSIKAKTFVRDYSLPLVITAILVVLVAGVAIARYSERASLADLLPGVSIGGQDYSTLFSKDKAEEFKKNEASGGESGQNTSTSTSGTSAATVALNSGSPGGTSAPGGGTNGGGTPAPTQPFSSSISSFQQSSVALECTSQVPRKNTCSKNYVFNAGVKTFNGPGSVSYSWQSNLGSANENGGFSAGSGDATTTLQKTITLACKNAASHTLKLVINTPTSQQSGTLNINHNCDDVIL